MNRIEPTPQEIESLHKQLFQEATQSGYHLNPDIEFTKELIKGLLINERRYGYWSCPCRLAEGNRVMDLDIICPCDYRDPDLNDYGTCYCKLYVSQAVVTGEKEVQTIPERRPPIEEREKQKKRQSRNVILPEMIWRCRVCGYLCAREKPPENCPICKAKSDRFERFT